mmetsp:Transcript_3117/g.5750  ORF Transcript_3117/g.5750 Transcript_3117/m.5750 type:complete len:88 (+) Transcript_3117:67-330(+)
MECRILEKLHDKVLDYRVDDGWAFYQTLQEQLNQEVTKIQPFKTKREKWVSGTDSGGDFDQWSPTKNKNSWQRDCNSLPIKHRMLPR